MENAQVPDGSVPIGAPQRERFAQLLASGTLSQADAYRQAYPVSVKWKDTAVNSKASQAAALPAVGARVRYLQGLAADEQVLTRAEALALVLADARAVVAADAAEVTRWRFLNCRHCWGVGFAYRWRSEREYWKALADAGEAQAKWDSTPEKRREGPRPEIPDDKGGYGFRRIQDVNPECPECEGEGTGETYLADTLKMSKNARVLFDGVKQTKNGIEIKTRDKEAARALLAKYAGIADAVDVRGGLAVAAVTATVTPEQAAAIAKKLSDDY